MGSEDHKFTVGLIGSGGRFGSMIKDVCALRDIQVYGFDKGYHHIPGPASLLPVQYDLAYICRESDILIFAVPMRNLEESLREVAPHVSPRTLIFDVCSLKMTPCAMLRMYFPNNEVIGTHPLFGPQSAKADNLTGHRIALCNVSAKWDTAVPVVEFLVGLGLKVLECSPEEHDEEMKTQALTHFIGQTAVRMGLKRTRLSTKSFEDLMDIVDLVEGGSLELFEDMQKLNPFAGTMRRDFLREAHSLDASLTMPRGES